MPAAPIVTPALLSSIRATPRLPQHCWYYITGVTLSALNRPDEIPKVLTWALENGTGPNDTIPPSQSEQLKVARRMREGLVKSAAIIGLPKTINALTSLKQSTPTALLSHSSLTHPTTRAQDILPTTPFTTPLDRGTTLFNTLYAAITPRITTQLRTAAPDLLLLARIAYGYILSGAPEILSGAEVSWAIIAGLIPQDVNPQLKGHLKGAVNLGAGAGEVRAVRRVVLGVCEAAGMRVGEMGGWREEVEDLAEGWTGREGKDNDGGSKRESKL